MSQTEFFSGQVMRAGNPLRFCGFTRIAVGMIFSLFALVVLAGMIPVLRECIASQGRLLGDSPQVQTYIVQGIIALVMLIIGANTITKGIGGISRIIVPPRAPRDLIPDEAIVALSRREMTTYSVTEGEPYWLLRHWFPHQFPLLTSRTRVFIGEGFSEIRRLAIIIMILAAIFIAIHIIPPDTAASLEPYFPRFPFIFLFCYALGALVHVAIVVRALPTMAPKADVSEFRMSVRGGGDPSHIPHSLQHELGAIRPSEGTPNRSFQEGFQMEQGGVSDAGQFEGKLVIENQPQVEVSTVPAHANILLIFGSLMQLSSLYWWFKFPAYASTASVIDVGKALLFAAWLGQLLAGILLNSLGKRMVDDMADVLNTYRFRSAAVVLDVKGNFARSQVRVGKAIRDSIESENLVVRSDCSVSGYTAALLTESLGLIGSRSIIGMVIDSSAREVERIVSEWLTRFEQQGATIVGVDLKDQKLIEIVHANIKVEEQRTASNIKAVKAANASMASFDAVHPTALLTDAPSEPTPISPTDEHPEQTKICPECAETIKAAALKCRFCGYRFPEPAS